jgi:hypothetical protein
MTTSLLIAALMGISFLCAHMGRTVVLLTLSYLALRRSEPDERKEILEALSPALGSVVSPASPHSPSSHSMQRSTAPSPRSCHDPSRTDPTLRPGVNPGLSMPGYLRNARKVRE